MLGLAKFTGQYVVNAQVLLFVRLSCVICVFIVFIGFSIFANNLLIVVIAVHKDLRSRGTEANQRGYDVLVIFILVVVIVL